MRETLHASKALREAQYQGECTRLSLGEGVTRGQGQPRGPTGAVPAPIPHSAKTPRVGEKKKKMSGFFFSSFFSILRAALRSTRWLSRPQCRVFVHPKAPCRHLCHNIVLMKLSQPLQLSSPPNNAFSVRP